MRNDMAKVVTEKPRRGSRNKSEKFGGRLSKDHVSREQEDDSERGGFIPWSRHRNTDSKEFSDLLGPLHKYLRKQVGRPWNHVYSELSQHLDRRSLSGLHIWGHVKGDVEIDCWMGVSGTVYSNRYSYKVSGLYVHPITGLLCYTRQVRPRYRPPVDPDVCKLTENTELHRFDGIWYHVTYTKQAFTRMNHKGEIVEDWLYRTVKKQLNKKELKQHKVVNGASSDHALPTSKLRVGGLTRPVRL